MQLTTLRSSGRVAVVLGGGRILTLDLLAGLAPAELSSEIAAMSLAAILAVDPDLERIRRALAAAEPNALAAAALDPATVRMGAPIPRPAKAIGVGYNYLDHIREQGLERPVRPVLFSMFANAVVAGGDPIRRPAGTHALDLEEIGRAHV